MLARSANRPSINPRPDIALTANGRAYRECIAGRRTSVSTMMTGTPARPKLRAIPRASASAPTITADLFAATLAG